MKLSYLAVGSVFLLPTFLDAIVLSHEEFMENTLSYSHIVVEAYHDRVKREGKDYGQLDQILKKYLAFPSGTFIEAGAVDGLTQSNTKIFEELFGWKGLLVEPSPAYKLCKINRPNSIVENCALVSFDYSKSYIIGDFIDYSPMSSIGGHRLNRTKSSDLVNVPAHTITYLLEKNNIKEIDFFSLDVEGAELEVLKGLDFSKYSPKFFLIEVYHHEFAEIVSFLTAYNYVIVEDFFPHYPTSDFPQERDFCDFLFARQDYLDQIKN